MPPQGEMQLTLQFRRGLHSADAGGSPVFFVGVRCIVCNGGFVHSTYNEESQAPRNMAIRGDPYPSQAEFPLSKPFLTFACFTLGRHREIKRALPLCSWRKLIL